MFDFKRKNGFLACILYLLVALCSQQAYGQANTLRIVPASINYSSEGEVAVVLENTAAASAFQFIVELPAGFTYVANSAALATDRKADHQLSASFQNGKLTIVGFSTTGADLKGTSGTLLSFKVKAPAQPGNYSFKLSGVEFSDKTGATVSVSGQAGTLSVLAPQLSGSSVIDYGRVPIREQRHQYLYLSNSGNQELIISSITTNDDRFTFTANFPIKIVPGSGYSLPVAFASEVKGTIEKQLTITSNSATSPEKTIALRATAFAVNEMRVNSVTSKNLEEATVSVSINNMEAFSAFGFKMLLTEEMEYVTNSVTLSSRKDDQTVSASVKGNVLTVVAFSPGNKALKLNDGEVLTFKLKTTGQGTFPLALQNAEIADMAGENVVSATYNGSLTIQSPYFSLSTTTIDFGEVSVTESKQQTLTVYNYGQADLVLTGLSLTSTYFTHDLDFPVTIAPGGSKVVTFTFAGAPAGTHQLTAKFYHSDKNRNPSDIVLKAVAFEPNTLAISELSGARGSVLQGEVKLTNYSKVAGLQLDVSLPAGLTTTKADFALTNRASGHSLSVSEVAANKFRVLVYTMNGATLSGNDGAIVTFPVTVSKSLADGNYNIAITGAEVSNDQSKDVLSATIDGAVTIAGDLKPGIKVSTTIVDFGEITAGTTKTEKVTIENTGNADLVISEAALEPLGFTHDLNLPLTIVPGEVQEFSVTFSPKTPGIYQDVLGLLHNVEEENQTQILLKGSAISVPKISLSKTTIDFGTLSVLETKQESLVINNTGEADLIISGMELASTYITHDLTFPVTITPGEARTMTFTLSGAPAGNHQITAKLQHNDADQNPSEIALKAIVYEPNILSVSDVSGARGGSAQVDVLLKNYSSITGYQLDLTLPEGLTTILGGFKLSERANGHSLSVKEVSPNVVRVVVFSTNAAVYHGNDGSVLTFPVQIGRSLADGTYTITITNPEVIDAKLKNVLSGVENGKITIAGALTEKAILVSPVANSIDVILQPKLVWQQTPDAQTYSLQLSMDADFTTIVTELSGLKDVNYSFAEDLVKNTTYFWRVKGVNNLGEGAWSEVWSFTTQDVVTGLSTEELAKTFYVYPNPSDGRLLLSLPAGYNADLLQLRDMHGKLVFERTLYRMETIVEMGQNNLASGTYMVVLFYKGKVIESRRWVKN